MRPAADPFTAASPQYIAARATCQREGVALAVYPPRRRRLAQSLIFAADVLGVAAFLSIAIIMIGAFL